MPVLSVLIAEVKPSVSTEGRSFTIALCLARSMPPSDKMVWVTVGSASGIAAIASETALRNRASHAVPQIRPSTNMTAMVIPAAPAIQSVSVLICLVMGGFSREVDASMPEILPTSVLAPVAVTMAVALPWVTGVFMNAMFAWSAGSSLPSASVVAALDAGRLSPVSSDSSICSELAAMMRQSAGTWSPAVMSTTSPTTTRSAGISASVPSRRTLAVVSSIDLSAFMTLSALPSCCIPITALTTVSTSSSAPVDHWAISSETIAAATRMSCM